MAHMLCIVWCASMFHLKIFAYKLAAFHRGIGVSQLLNKSDSEHKNKVHQCGMLVVLARHGCTPAHVHDQELLPPSKESECCKDCFAGATCRDVSSQHPSSCTPQPPPPAARLSLDSCSSRPYPCEWPAIPICLQILKPPIPLSPDCSRSSHILSSSSENRKAHACRSCRS